MFNSTSFLASIIRTSDKYYHENTLAPNNPSSSSACIMHSLVRPSKEVKSTTRLNKQMKKFPTNPKLGHVPLDRRGAIRLAAAFPRWSRLAAARGGGAAGAVHGHVHGAGEVRGVPRLPRHRHRHHGPDRHAGRIALRTGKNIVLIFHVSSVVKCFNIRV